MSNVHPLLSSVVIGCVTVMQWPLNVYPQTMGPLKFRRWTVSGDRSPGHCLETQVRKILVMSTSDHLSHLFTFHFNWIDFSGVFDKNDVPLSRSQTWSQISSWNLTSLVTTIYELQWSLLENWASCSEKRSQKPTFWEANSFEMALELADSSSN